MSTLHRNQAAGWWNPSGWIVGTIVAVLVMSWPKRLVCALGAAGVVTLAGHFCGAFSIGLRDPSRGLPVSANERAPLFTQAWTAHRTEAGMMRFILPSDEAKLQTWIAANPVPAAVADVLPAERKIKTIFVQRDDADGAVVKVQISDRGAAGDRPKASGGTALGVFMQRQMWSFSGGNWHFSPDVPAAAAADRVAGFDPTNSRPNVVTNSAANSVGRSSSDGDDHPPPRAHTSSNVIIPSTVPSWARTH